MGQRKQDKAIIAARKVSHACLDSGNFNMVKKIEGTNTLATSFILCNMAEEPNNWMCTNVLKMR